MHPSHLHVSLTPKHMRKTKWFFVVLGRLLHKQ
jgi:hypothetical protein